MFASSESLSKNKFSYADDRRLKKWVKILENNWKEIAEKMHNKNARQCKDRWEKYLSPNVKSEPFSIDEDIAILNNYQVIGPKWIEMSKLIPGRSDVSLKSRYKLLQRHGKTLEMLLKVKSNMIKIENEEKLETQDALLQLDELFNTSDPLLEDFEFDF
ncbi:Myb-like DNA-binding domain containing protein [Trichomonas vaginalis G3]|uniref:Myb-like DNA-binding domain containing protein n=1 Tax=Trichomonas vaginalis (strain ATCC PRA-98 / G3) TaxID=412133 RepID=A2DR69_TRIV3|nr:RNA polymerase II transcription regulator recruiting protein [Trichomonas vaginalis G3]EAY17168.1 Myb-like DNA-binding domain containing protein [Trichomonas vaginalis G3]KAI5508898.1 RNA polymerase II transcription regulator recruiting protein [Trichomonas vaginalis G3]|eukprot:XP_001329391.1 Myb-like DNA-binding domain containing protein [Trichomonas vaginalis G3]